MDEQRVGTAPKPYIKPEVVLYGHLAELTKLIANGNGRNDNVMGNDKTGP